MPFLEHYKWLRLVEVGGVPLGLRRVLVGTRCCASARLIKRSIVDLHYSELRTGESPPSCPPTCPQLIVALDSREFHQGESPPSCPPTCPQLIVARASRPCSVFELNRRLACTSSQLL